MCVDDIDAGVHAGVSGRAGEKRLVDKCAAGMESDAGDLNASGDLRELWVCGDGDERKIGAANFCGGAGLESEHGSVGGGTEIRYCVIGGEGGELIGRGRIPERERATGCVGERDEDLIAIAIGLHERRAGDAGDFGFRGLLKSRGTCGQI